MLVRGTCSVIRGTLQQIAEPGTSAMVECMTLTYIMAVTLTYLHSMAVLYITPICYIYFRYTYHGGINTIQHYFSIIIKMTLISKLFP